MLILKDYPEDKLQKYSQELITFFKEDTLIKAKYILPTTERVPFKRILNPDQFLKNPPSYTEGPSLAYLAWQFPLSYAIIQRCLYEIRRRNPSFKPVSLLDWGSGPAVGALAALEVWNDPSVDEVDLVDYSESMLQTAQKMLHYTHPSIKTSLMKEIDPISEKKYHLVIASQSLNELPNDKERLERVKELFMKTDSYLLLIERGTPEGSRIIQGIRDSFRKGDLVGNDDIGSVSRIFAPCSHELECPFLKNGSGDWCHFRQRSELSALQMSIKVIRKGFNDPSFTYLILQKNCNSTTTTTTTDTMPTRIIKEPIKRKGHIVQHYCTPSTILKGVVARSDGKDIYHDGRKSSRGDIWPHSLKRLGRNNLFLQGVEE